MCIDGVSSVSEAPRPPEAGALLGAATENVSQMIEVVLHVRMRANHNAVERENEFTRRIYGPALRKIHRIRGNSETVESYGETRHI